jgi:hypothetical protein
MVTLSMMSSLGEIGTIAGYTRAKHCGSTPGRFRPDCMRADIVENPCDTAQKANAQGIANDR